MCVSVRLMYVYSVFGKANTDYDWKAHNPNEAQKELTRLQEEQSKLSKSINKKVMSMYEK